MMLIFNLAIRNLRRHLRRTLITMASIAFGLAVILWLQCILAGRNQDMINTITSAYTGHLQVYRADYLKDKLVQRSFPGLPENMQKALPEKAAFAQRVHLPALISSGEQSMPVLLEGIDPQAEAAITKVSQNKIEGSYLEPEADADCPSRQIYLGRALSEILRVGIGNKVVIMAQAADGTLGNDLFRVKGIFDSGSPDYDKAYTFAPLPCVAKVGAIKGVHEVVIRLPDQARENEIRRALSEKATGDLVVTSWREALPSVATMVKYNGATLVMISTMLFIVITLGIVNTLLMSIFERTREFGVAIALGTTPWQLRSIVITESLLLAVVSAALGTAIGVIAVIYHQHTGFDLKPFLGDTSSADQFKLSLVIHPIFSFASFLKTVLLTIFFVVIAGLYPAYRASRLNPVDAMRST